MLLQLDLVITSVITIVIELGRASDQLRLYFFLLLHRFFDLAFVCFFFFLSFCRCVCIAVYAKAYEFAVPTPKMLFSTYLENNVHPQGLNRRYGGGKIDRCKGTDLCEDERRSLIRAERGGK